MKNLYHILTIFICLVVLSCSSSDDWPQPVSKFTVNGTDYPTPNGYLISATDGVHNSRHALYLLNGTILNNEWYGEACDYSNDLTHGVIFNITSSAVNELAAGTYTYALNTTAPSLNESSIATGFTMNNNCITGANWIDEDQITSGSLTVQVSGDTYTLNYTFETSDFGTVAGTYVGTLQPVQDRS